MNKKILIYFGNHEDKRSVVERILQDLQIPYQILTDENLLDTTGYLMDLDGFQKHTTGKILHYESDLMILNNIEDDEILHFNSLCSAFDVEMKRKAMLTKHNQNWMICDLLKEIEKEHRYFQQVDEIRNILMKSKDLIIEHYTKESWQVYEQAFYHSYECISKESTPEEVESAYIQLIEAKDHLVNIM